MKRELVGSALAHAIMFVVLVWISTPGASVPPVPPEDIMQVTPVDALPRGLAGAPEVDVPSHADEVEAAAPTEVAIPEPEAIPVEPKPKPKTAETQKPKPKPSREQVAKPAETKPQASTEGDGIIESTIQSGRGSTQGSLLGVQGGVAGGRPGTYPDRVVNKVYYVWKNPAKLQDTIQSSVVFRIDSDGRASQIALERSSGMPAFDNSAVRAVYEAAPYPLFPRSMTQEYIVMRIIFEYVP